MRPYIPLAGLALLAGAACAEGYEPRGLLTTGYFEHRESDGTWFVGASSRAHEGFAAAERIALYRAAALAREQGHRYVQILRIRTERLSLRSGPEIRESTHLEVRFADSPAGPADCRQPKNFRDQCRTLDGTSILVRYAQEMGQEPPPLPPDLQPQPLPAGLEEATTLVRFTVSETGQPSDCSIVETTAPPALAGAACSVLLKHGHYSPAHGPDGKPVAQTQTLRFRWRMPASAGVSTPPAATVAAEQPVPPKKPAPAAAPPRPKLYPKDDTVQTPV
jgi:hypothetical protein